MLFGGLHDISRNDLQNIQHSIGGHFPELNVINHCGIPNLQACDARFGKVVGQCAEFLRSVAERRRSKVGEFGRSLDLIDTQVGIARKPFKHFGLDLLNP